MPIKFIKPRLNGDSKLTVIMLNLNTGRLVNVTFTITLIKRPASFALAIVLMFKSSDHHYS